MIRNTFIRIKLCSDVTSYERILTKAAHSDEGSSRWVWCSLLKAQVVFTKHDNTNSKDVSIFCRSSQSAEKRFLLELAVVNQPHSVVLLGNVSLAVGFRGVALVRSPSAAHLLLSLQGWVLIPTSPSLSANNPHWVKGIAKNYCLYKYHREKKR